MRPHFILLLPFLFLISSCSKVFISFTPKDDSKTIFIHMPKSNFVFDNIAPLVHRELTKHYRRTGYTLVNNSFQDYEMTILITSLTPQTKFISPDILLFHSTIQLTLECTLFDKSGAALTKKSFSFSTLINKARSPILRSNFLTYEYQKLLRRSVYKIEQHFRSFFLK